MAGTPPTPTLPTLPKPSQDLNIAAGVLVLVGGYENFAALHPTLAYYAGLASVACLYISTRLAAYGY